MLIKNLSFNLFLFCGILERLYIGYSHINAPVSNDFFLFWKFVNSLYEISFIDNVQFVFHFPYKFLVFIKTVDNMIWMKCLVMLSQSWYWFVVFRTYQTFVRLVFFEICNQNIIEFDSLWLCTLLIWHLIIWLIW
jgi:hypothetical protein